ncbi:hypothetical protein GCM10011571_32570 [Marinithermofilum abyssi]|uniref:DUF3179 domain-containing protein n=1 Tax=Marinithermofilum abyssi TaxID=1571185 RepID=A0A8J2VIS0_9BACL|nr:DUF3179 domain-containing (seleno)protein [Marinithermofilum abyssi]GGE27887.1 hypothetical protein GCM10011571_32570 [Marinithermofilum abyssi]
MAKMQAETFNVKRVIKDNHFQPFLVSGSEPLSEVVRRKKMKPKDEILVVERRGQRLAFSLYQMTYHHVAQGELAGQPFILAFCAICNSATSMDPVVDGTVHNFSCIGIYNGMALLEDTETGSYWDHISGECLHGPLKGKMLSLYPVQHLTVEQALKKWPELPIAMSQQPLYRRLIVEPLMNLFGKYKIFPPYFYLSMGKEDTRLPKMTSGLGIYTKKTKRFYPIHTIKSAGGKLRDQVDGRPVTITIDIEGFPKAEFANGEKPTQIYCRWYGFAYTFPGCELYEEKSEQ